MQRERVRDRQTHPNPLTTFEEPATHPQVLVGARAGVGEEAAAHRPAALGLPLALVPDDAEAVDVVAAVGLHVLAGADVAAVPAVVGAQDVDELAPAVDVKVLAFAGDGLWRGSGGEDTHRAVKSVRIPRPRRLRSTPPAAHLIQSQRQFTSKLTDANPFEVYPSAERVLVSLPSLLGFITNICPARL